MKIPFVNIKSKYTKPLAVYVGRVSKEKNLEAFLSASVDCNKWVIGDGPELERLKHKYRNFDDIDFFGRQDGVMLKAFFATADVFVFPSKSDTFGLVILQALACGTPVAAYNVQGPKDILNSPKVGCVHDDLEFAIKSALKHGDPDECEKLALSYNWYDVTSMFIKNLKFNERVL